MSITVDNVVKDTPVDDFQEQKVVDYNAIFAAMNAAWSAWTPALTNLTIGNGVITGKYRQIGKLVFFRLTIVLGSTSSIGGSVSFALPVTRAANAGTAGLTPNGQARFLDSSSGNKMEGVAINLTTTTAGLNVLDSSGTYLNEVNLSSTIPFVWATSDEINVQGFYEAA